MRIKKMSINGLFGMFNYTIPFRTTERITIIHAPNGYGKTTILKLIDDIFNDNISEIKNVPFDKITFDYTDKSRFNIKKVKEGKKEIIRFSLKISGVKKQISFDYLPIIEYSTSAMEYVEENLPSYIKRIGINRWLDIRQNREINIDYLIDRYLPHHIKSDFFHMRRTIKKMPMELRDHLKSLQTRFIRSQRLYHFESPRTNRITTRKEKETTPSVIIYSDDLRRGIERKLAESASYSQKLDRTFPSRLIKKMATIDTDKAPSRKSIEQKLIGLENTRTRLQNVGLFTGETIPIETEEKMDKHTLEVLSMFIEDNEKKLRIFKDMERKINLIKDILNSRYSHKEISISSEEGFMIALFDGTKLNLENLSSGEQHELVLNYELLFNSKEGSLILMDEPEISLHIGWQKQFLNDLKKIADLTNVDILIATHSPQIINDKWNLTVELSEGNG